MDDAVRDYDAAGIPDEDLRDPVRAALG